MIRPDDLLDYCDYQVAPVKTITTDEFFYWRVNANFFGTDNYEYCRLIDNVGVSLTWDYEDIIVLKKLEHPEYYL